MSFEKNWLFEIEEVVSTFDAERVCRVMNFLDWVWYDTTLITPGAIRFELRELIISTAKRMVKDGLNTATTRTRGFKVTVERYWDTDKLYIDATFEVTWVENS